MAKNPILLRISKLSKNNIISIAEQQYVTVKIAAELLNHSQTRIKDYASKGLLRAKKVGNRLLFISLDDLKNFTFLPMGRPHKKVGR